jgi:membrane fusion protein, multidrug efflux system
MRCSLKRPALWRWRLSFPLAIAAAAVLALAVSSCSRDTKDAAAKGGPVVPVSAQRAAVRDVPVEIRTFGTVHCPAVVTIKPQVSDVITKVHFEKGQVVKKGDTLFSLDGRTYQLTLDQAKAKVDRDKFLLTKLRRDAQHMDELFHKGACTPNEHDQSQVDADAADRLVASEDAAVKQAELDLAHCQVCSPITGRTGDVLCTEGNLAMANQTLLVAISQMEPIEVNISVSQPELLAIRAKMSSGIVVTAYVSPEDTRGEQGKLTFIDSSVDNTTGMATVAATFANEGEALWPGQYVRVSIQLEMLRGKVLVPTRALQAGREGQFVYVVSPDKTARFRRVVAGAVMDDCTVVESGLVAGELVVTEGQFRLTDGSKVAVKEAKPTSASAPAATAAGGRL